MATIFLDRDGVINENRPDYVKCWEEFRFLPGSREGIASLTRAGHRLIICTNQAGIAKGTISFMTLEDIHQHMLAEIDRTGGTIEKIYFCPHRKEALCPCRKPHPGLLLRARDELDLDMHNALFIGDSITDIQAGLAAGVHSMLVLTGLGREQLSSRSQEAGGPFLVMSSLKHAADTITGGTSYHGETLPIRGL